MDKVTEGGSRIPTEVARGACRNSFAQSGPTCFYAMITKYCTGMGGRPGGPLKQEEVVLSEGSMC